jgi:hypothetical protein
MAGSGSPGPTRLVTFIEVKFSRNWRPDEQADPSTGFVSWTLYLDEPDPTGSISITRSDGKVLSFDQTAVGLVVQTRDNVIRWSAYPEFVGSDGPFQ